MLPPSLWYRAFQNAITWRLRNRFRFGRAGYAESSEGVAAVVADHPRLKRIQELVGRYHPAIGEAHSAKTILWNLSVLDLLDRVGAPPTRPVRALDVGCESFGYAPALHAFWGATTPVERLVGVEIDPFQVSAGGHSRADAARYYVGPLPHTKFVAGDVRDLEGTFNAVTMFLPFLHPKPHVAWGLPADRLDPDGVFAHVWSLVEPGGTVIVANQGEFERDLQLAQLERFGLAPASTFELTDPLVELRHRRFVHVLRKR